MDRPRHHPDSLGKTIFLGAVLLLIFFITTEEKDPSTLLWPKELRPSHPAQQILLRSTASPDGVTTWLADYGADGIVDVVMQEKRGGWKTLYDPSTNIQAISHAEAQRQYDTSTQRASLAKQ